MAERSIEQLLAELAFFEGLPGDTIKLIAGCGRNAVFHTDQALAREGDPADHFFVLRSGQVAIETHAPGRPALRVQTVGPGEVIGWSWLFEPHRWEFDIVAVEEARVIALDGACLRGKCETDHELGYQLMNRFAGIMVGRLRATRLQLLDIYGEGAR